MPRTAPTVFFSRNFNEFRAYDNPLRKELMGSVFGFELMDLGEGKAQAQNPIKTSLSYAELADVVVVFIGSEYGGVPSDPMHDDLERSYVHQEFLHSLKNTDSYTLVYCIGEDYVDGLEFAHKENPEMKSLISDVLQNCTAGVFTQEFSMDEVVKHVVKDVERVFNNGLNVGGESKDSQNLSFSKDHQWGNISGFQVNRIDQYEDNIRKQLEVIFGLRNEDDISSLFPSSSDAGNFLVQKYWAVENIKLNNLSGAIKNFQNCLQYFESDIMSNYWLARCLLEGECTNEDLKEAQSKALLCNHLCDHFYYDVPIIKSLNLITLSKIAAKSNDDEKRSEYSDEAIQVYGLYDALAEEIEVSLTQYSSSKIKDKKKKDELLQKARTTAGSLFRKQDLYYFSLMKQLKKKLPNDVVELVSDDLSKKVAETLSNVIKNGRRISIQIEELDDRNSLVLDYTKKIDREVGKIYENSLPIWVMLRIGRKISMLQHELLVEYAKIIDDHHENYQKEYVKMIDLREKMGNFKNKSEHMIEKVFSDRKFKKAFVGYATLIVILIVFILNSPFTQNLILWGIVALLALIALRAFKKIADTTEKENQLTSLTQHLYKDLKIDKFANLVIKGADGAKRLIIESENEIETLSLKVDELDELLKDMVNKFVEQVQNYESFSIASYHGKLNPFSRRFSTIGKPFVGSSDDFLSDQNSEIPPYLNRFNTKKIKSFSKYHLYSQTKEGGLVTRYKAYFKKNEISHPSPEL